MQRWMEPEKVHRPCAHYAESTVSTVLKEQSKFQPPINKPVGLREKLPVRSSENGVPISFVVERDQLLRRRSRSLSPYRSCGCRRHDPDSPRRSRSMSSPSSPRSARVQTLDPDSPRRSQGVSSPLSPRSARVQTWDSRYSVTRSLSPNGSLRRSPTDRAAGETDSHRRRIRSPPEFWRPISAVDSRQRQREDQSTKSKVSLAPRLESVLNHAQVRARGPT